METVSGASNWKLVFRREGGGVTILRAGTPDVRPYCRSGSSAFR